MNIWNVLEIEKTKDKDSIQNAYRRKVVTVNPEEDQQGFMELRKAYEEAMKWADLPEEMEAENAEAKKREWPDTPIGNLMARADELYENIELRCDVEKWKALLDSELCFSLETKTEVRDELLTYFLDHRFLPQKIWKLIDATFSIQEYKEELYEIFPVNYVNHGVIGNIENEELIAIEYLKSNGGDRYDEYLELCYRLNNVIGQGDAEEANKLFGQLKELKIYHPFEAVCQVRYFLLCDDIEGAELIAKGLMEVLPEDSEALRARGDVYYAKQDYAKAKECYEKILAMYPDYYNIIVSMGHACFQLKEFEEAKKYYNRAYDIHKSYYLEQDMLSCSTELEKEYERKWKENPDDSESAIELARAYYQQSKFEEAINVLNTMKPTEETHIEHVHLFGCVYMYQDKYEEAVTYIKQWVEATEQLKDDGTEKTKKAMDRLSASYQCMAQALTGLKRYEEADAYLEKALATNHNIIDTYEDRVRIYFQQKRYDDAIQVCEQVLEIDQSSSLGNGMKAEALFELYYLEDSLEQWNRCIQLVPNNLHFYMKKIECLFMLGERDEILEVIQFLEENNAESERIDMWKAVVEGEWGDKEQALEDLSKLTKKFESYQNDGEKEFLGELYYEMARIHLNKNRDLHLAEWYVDKTLEFNPNFVKALNYKGYICWKTNRPKEAIPFYQKVLEEKPNHFNANGNLGEVYEELSNFEMAVEYYTRQLNHAPNAYMYLSRGWSYAALDEFEKSRRDYEKSIEMEPENPHVYRDMALTYKYEEQEEKAIELLEKSIELDTDNEMIWAYRDLAESYLRIGEDDKAIQTLEVCYEKFKENRELHRLARANMHKGCYEEAYRRYLQYAANGKNFRQDIIGKQGECLLMMGRVKETMQLISDSYDELIKGEGEAIDPSSVKWLQFIVELYSGMEDRAKETLKSYTKGYIKDGDGSGEDVILLQHLVALNYQKGNKIKVSRKNFEKVLKKLEEEMQGGATTKRREASRQCTFAVMEMGRENYDKALEWAEKAICNRKCYTCDFCGECVDALFIKAVILETLGREEEALAFYERAKTIDKTDIRYLKEYERLKAKLSKS